MLPAAPFQSLIDPEDIAGFAQNGLDRGNHACIGSADFGFMGMISPWKQPGSAGSLSFDVPQRFGAVRATVTAMGFSIRKIASFASQVSSQVSSLAHSATSALGSKSSKPPGHQSHHGGLAGLKPRENTHARQSAKVHPAPMEMEHQPLLQQQNSLPRDASVRQQSPQSLPPRASLPRSESPKMAYQQYQQPVYSPPPQPQAPAPALASHHISASTLHRRRPTPQGALGANAAQMTGAAMTPQRTKDEAVRPDPKLAEARLDKLTARVDRLSPKIDNLLDQIHDLKLEYAESTHPGDRAEIRAELQAFEKELAQLDKRDRAARTEINFLTKPKTNADVKMLMQLAKLEGPQETGGQRDIIEGNFDNLRNNGSLLNKRDNLVATQKSVQAALERGYFNSLPPAELKDMRDLANLNIDTKLGRLADVKEVVDHTRKQLKKMGAEGLFEGIRTTPQERAASIKAERDSHQEALDNGY